MLVHDGVCAISSIDDFLLRAKAISWIFTTRQKRIIKEDITVWNSTKSHCIMTNVKLQEDGGTVRQMGGLAFTGRFSRKSIFGAPSTMRIWLQ